MSDDDQDQMFLDQVLNRLYDFGDASKKKKKRKRKSCVEEDQEDQQDAAAVEKNRDRGEEIRRPGEDSSDAEKMIHRPGEDSSDAEQKGRPVPHTAQVEVVTFQDPGKRDKTKHSLPGPELSTVPQKTVQKSDKTEQLSLEKARLEVHRFGITGYRKEQQRVFEQDRAIMLGARPPKKEYVNYKLLQQQVKDKKQKSKEEAETNLKKNKKKQSKPRDKKKKSSSSGSGSGGSGPSGQMGRFKNGVLMLSHQDIQKIKGNMARR